MLSRRHPKGPARSPAKDDDPTPAKTSPGSLAHSCAYTKMLSPSRLFLPAAVAASNHQ